MNGPDFLLVGAMVFTVALFAILLGLACAMTHPRQQPSAPEKFCPHCGRWWPFEAMWFRFDPCEPVRQMRKEAAAR